MTFVTNSALFSKGVRELKRLRTSGIFSPSVLDKDLAYNQLVYLYDLQRANLRRSGFMHSPRVRYGDWLRSCSTIALGAPAPVVCRSLVLDGSVLVDGLYVSLEV